MSRRTAWNIAQEQGWETTFDAEYLAVTKLQADAFVTIDAAMAAKVAPDEAVSAATRAGATVADHQPQANVRVLFDPAGHPFCRCLDTE